MYMPLCRDCHTRESRLNSKNHFEGDPEHVDLKAETEAKPKREESVIKIQVRAEEDPKSFSTDMDSSISSLTEIMAE